MYYQGKHQASVTDGIDGSALTHRNRIAATLKHLEATGTSIIWSDQEIDVVGLRGLRELCGTELFPAIIAWQPGSRVIYLWHSACAPTDPGHETHRYEFVCDDAMMTHYDVVAQFLSLADSNGWGWIVESLRAIIDKESNNGEGRAW